MESRRHARIERTDGRLRILTLSVERRGAKQAACRVSQYLGARLVEVQRPDWR